MLSRRSFLSMSATLAVAPAPGSARRQEADERGVPALPPSVQRLSSMRDQARPITTDERRRARRAGHAS